MKRYVLALAILCALIVPAHYAALYFLHPPGMIFAGFQDDGAQLTAMKAYLWDFQDPWRDTSFFSNVMPGPVHFYAAVGVLSHFIDAYLLLLALIFVSTLAFFKVHVDFMKTYLGKNAWKGMILFLIPSGVGGVLYTLFLAFSPENAQVVGGFLTYEFNEFSGVHAFQQIFRLYPILSETLGLLGLMSFMQKKKIHAGIFMGLSMFVYPQIGFFYPILVLVHCALEEKRKISILKGVWKTFVVAGAFLVPWGVSYVIDKHYIDFYRSAFFQSANAVTVLITFFLYISLALVYARKKHFTKDEKFLAFWVITAAAMAILPPLLWNSQKMLFMLPLPLSILAFLSLNYFSRRHGIGLNKAIAIIVIIAVPSFVIFNVNIQLSARSPGNMRTYLSEGDMAAFEYLKNSTDGRVMSLERAGYYIPYYTGQRAAAFFKEDGKDYEGFFNGTRDEMISVLREFNATYVYIGVQEKASFMGLDCLREAYKNSNVSIYSSQC